MSVIVKISFGNVQNHETFTRLSKICMRMHCIKYCCYTGVSRLPHGQVCAYLMVLQEKDKSSIEYSRQLCAQLQIS